MPHVGELDVEGDGGNGPDWLQVPFRPLGRSFGPGDAGYTRPVSAFAGRRDEGGIIKMLSDPIGNCTILLIVLQ